MSRSYFYSRPREGGDTHSIAYLYECLISIHAPPEGGDPAKVL